MWNDTMQKTSKKTFTDRVTHVQGYWGDFVECFLPFSPKLWIMEFASSLDQTFVYCIDSTNAQFHIGKRLGNANFKSQINKITSEKS